MPSEERAPISVVLSDIDGVLIDSAKAVFESYKTAFHFRGISLPEHIFREMIWGNSWLQACHEMEHCWSGKQDWSAIHDLKQEAFENMLETGNPAAMRVNDLLCAILETLFGRNDVDLRLITAGSVRASQLKMEWLAKVRCRALWSALPIAAGMDKKHPDTWRSIASYHEPDRIVVIEDDQDVLNVIHTKFPKIQTFQVTFGELRKVREMDKVRPGL